MSGGVSATLRDTARFGQMHLQIGLYKETQIVPAEWIRDTLTNGSREAWAKGDFAEFLPNCCYRNQWYNSGNNHESFFAAGAHGQHIYIDPFADMVIVKLSSMPIAMDEILGKNTFLGFEALGNFLTDR